MDKFEEIEFIHRLSIDKLKRTQSGFVGRCQICGDSQKSKSKTRLYILTNGLFISVYCHNCGFSSNLKCYIYNVNKDLYKEYQQAERKHLLASLENHTLFSKSQTEINNFEQSKELKYTFQLNPDSFKSIALFPAHVKYCLSRKIPEEIIVKLFVCTKKSLPYYNMVIFPFYISDSLVYGFQGRSIDKKQFLTFSPNDSFKVYNLFNINKKKIL